MLGLLVSQMLARVHYWAALTKARPEIGNYPFTTLSPNLGVTMDESDCAH